MEIYNLRIRELVWLYEIRRTNNVILAVFAKPYALMIFKTFENFESILWLSKQSDSQKKAAQIIFGAFQLKENLPVTCGENLKRGDGLQTTSLNRLTLWVARIVLG